MVCVEETSPNFINRVTNLPVVSSAWSYARDLYGKTKDSNSVLKKTLDTVETTAKFATGRAMPVISRLEKPLNAVDSLACKGLDRVEGKLPVITKSPEEIMDTLKTLGMQKMNNAKSTATSVGSYGCTTATKLLDNKYGLLALDGVNWTLATADTYLEYYLPAGEEESEEEKNPEGEDIQDCPAVEVKVKTSVRSVAWISTKVKRRVNYSARSKLKDLVWQKNIVSATDLVKNVKEMAYSIIVGMVNKGRDIWEEIKKEETEEHKQLNLETCAVIAARRLNQQMKLLTSSAMETVKATAGSLELVANIYKQAIHVQDYISITSLRERLLKLQDAVTDLIMNALTWLKSIAAKETKEETKED